MKICIVPPRLEPKPPALVGNMAQTCCLSCGDGTEFCVTIPPNTVLAKAQIIADRMAHSIACFQAANHRFCIPNFPSNRTLYCLNQLIDISLTVTQGQTPLTWTLIGSLPVGLIATNSDNTRTLFLNGKPHIAGTYTFSYLVTDNAGFKIKKTFTMKIFGVVEATLPDANGGVFYSQQLHGDGSVSPYSFTISKGSLPPDMTLSADGLISGNASCGGGQIYDFTVQIKDAGGVTCNSDLSINCLGAPQPPPPTCPGLASTVPLGDRLAIQLAGCDFRRKIYVPITNTNSVAVMSTQSNTFVGSANLPSTPNGICYVPPKRAASSVTSVTSNFIVPSVGATVAVVVGDTSAMAVNKIVFIDSPQAAFQATQIPDSSHVVLKFLGFSGDVAPGTSISATSHVFIATPKSDLVYVCRSAPDGLCAIDPDAGICFDVASLDGNGGRGRIFYSPTSNVICFGEGGHLYSYDLATGTLNTTGQSGKIIGYCSSLDRMYIQGQDGSNSINTAIPKTLVVVSPATMRTALPLCQGEGAFCADTGHIYFTSTSITVSSDNMVVVSVFDPATGLSVANVSLVVDGSGGAGASISGCFWDVAGRRIIVSLYKKIAVINPFNRALLCYVNTDVGANKCGYYSAQEQKDYTSCTLNSTPVESIQIIS